MSADSTQQSHESWPWGRISDLCEGVIDCPHSTPKLTDQGPFVARTQDIASGVFRSESAARVSMETYQDRIARAEPRHGDLLYSREGAYFGVAAEVPKDMSVCLGQRMVLIRPKSDLIDHQFLKYWLNSPQAVAHAWSHVEGSAAPRINLPSIRAFSVPIPPLVVQHSIAACLGSLDNKIESNRRVIQLASDLLDARSAEYAETLVSVSLAHLVTTTKLTVDPTSLADTEVDHFSLPAFDNGGWPERVMASTIMSRKFAITQPSILVSRLNPRFNRTWWAVPTDGVPALASTEFTCLVLKAREDLAALWLAVRDECFRAEVIRRASGTSGSHQRVRPDDLLTIEVPDIRKLSPSEKCDALALLDLIHERRIESARLAELRDVLLPELITGRLRLPEILDVLEEMTG